MVVLTKEGRLIRPRPVERIEKETGMKRKVIGLTGTRCGMTNQQEKTVALLLEKEGCGCIFHHGDCVGADAQAHYFALKNKMTVILHPALNVDPKYLANCQGASGYWMSKPALDRNKDIVDCCSLLIAAPKGFKEEQRSSVWYTIRYAVWTRIDVMVVWPDGRYESIVTLPLEINREVKQTSKRRLL